MADVVPHLAFPLRFRAGRFLSVEQGSQRHLEDQADLLLRTRPGTLEPDPAFGLRDQVGRLGPVAPAVLGTLARTVDASFGAAEGLPERVRDVAVAITNEDRED